MLKCIRLNQNGEKPHTHIGADWENEELNTKAEASVPSHLHVSEVADTRIVALALKDYPEHWLKRRLG